MPSGLIKLKYTGIEDNYFIKNPQISYYKKIYRKYSNFIKVTEKIELGINYSLSNETNIYVNIDNINYDLVSSLYLYIELNKSITFDILHLIDKIEFYCSDILIDTLTPDIIKLYSSIYYSPSKYNLHNLTYINNKRNIYYIPLNFMFLNKSQTYIPLYLLTNEKIYLQIYFKGNEFENLYANKLEVIAHYITLENINKTKLQTNYWLIESITYMNNFKLNVSLNKDVPNKIDLLSFKKNAKALIFILNNCSVDDFNIYIDSLKLHYTSAQLKYLNLLHTKLQYNTFNTPNNSLYLYNFSLFNNNPVSGYLNLNTINRFYLELFPYKKNTFIIFSILTVFTNYFYITTDLLLDGKNRSPMISIYTNVTYQLYNHDTDIIILTTNPETYINNNQQIPLTDYYSGYDYNNKTLLINDIDTVTDNILYYCDKTKNIAHGMLKVNYDNNAIVGEGFIDTYTINHDMYSIKNGKLNILSY
tara:strand:- start:312 stop:1736 length:1425 start_codon:yes stop_codon:yes gene_type:complete